jgi:hypothetical protein
MKWVIAAAGVVVLAQAASAQQPISVFNPVPSYSSPRPSVTPYLNLLRGGDMSANYYSGVWAARDIRGLQMQPNFMMGMPQLNPGVDDRADLELRDKQLPPTGHQAGFMIYNAYYRMPNQRAFIPYNPYNQAQGGMQQYR